MKGEPFHSKFSDQEFKSKMLKLVSDDFKSYGYDVSDLGITAADVLIILDIGYKQGIKDGLDKNS